MEKSGWACYILGANSGPDSYNAAQSLPERRRRNRGKNKGTESMQARRIIVHGKVQGVGFRYFVRHVAGKLGLVGDVRNCPDLTVEIHVEGKAGDIEKFIEQVRQGPPLSWVRQVDVVDMRATGSYDSFLIEGW